MVPKSKIPFFTFMVVRFFSSDCLLFSFFSSHTAYSVRFPLYLYVLMSMTRRLRLRFIFAGPLFCLVTFL